MWYPGIWRQFWQATEICFPICARAVKFGKSSAMVTWPFLNATSLEHWIEWSQAMGNLPCGQEVLWGPGPRRGILVASQENILLGLGWASWILLWGRGLGSADHTIMSTFTQAHQNSEHYQLFWTEGEREEFIQRWTTQSETKKKTEEVSRAKAIWRNPKAIGLKVTLPVGSWTFLSQAARLALIHSLYHFHHLWQKNTCGIWWPQWHICLRASVVCASHPYSLRAEKVRQVEVGVGARISSRFETKGKKREGRLGPWDGLPARAWVWLNIERGNKKYYSFIVTISKSEGSLDFKEPVCNVMHDFSPVSLFIGKWHFILLIPKAKLDVLKVGKNEWKKERGRWEEAAVKGQHR